MTRTRIAVGFALCSLVHAAVAGRQTGTLLAVRDAQISPDGRSVVFTRGALDPARSSLPVNLWRIPFAGGAPQRLTSSDTLESEPRWSPDGESVGFLSRPLAAGARSEVFVLTGAQKPRRIACGDSSAIAFDWSLDARTIACLIDGPDGRRLWVADVATGNSHIVPSLASAQVLAFAWGPDSATLAALTDGQLVAASPSGNAKPSVIVPRLTAPQVFAWGRANGRLAWLDGGTSGPQRRIMVSAIGGSTRDVSIAGEGVPVDLAWTGKGHLSAVYDDGRGKWIDVIDPAARTRTTVMPRWVAAVVSRPVWSADGVRYTVVARTEGDAPEVFAGSLPPPYSNAPDFVGAAPPPVRRLTFSNR